MCVCLVLSVPHSASVSHLFCLSVCLSVCLSLSLSLSPRSLMVGIGPTRQFHPDVSNAGCLSVSKSLCPTLCLVSHLLCLSVSVCLSLSLCLCLSVSFGIFVSVCLHPSLPQPLLPNLCNLLPWAKRGHRFSSKSFFSIGDGEDSRPRQWAATNWPISAEMA